MSKVKKSLVMFTVLIFSFIITYANLNVLAAEITPTEGQRIEFKVVSVEEVEGKDKQVIAELWAYNMEFSAIDLNIFYDEDKLSPSNLETNDYIQSQNAIDNNMFWETQEIKENLDSWIMNYTSDWLQYIYSLLFSQTIQSQHIYMGTNSNQEEYMSVKAGVEGVMLGKFSYRLQNGEIDSSTFSLKQTTNQPTGIQVIIDNVNEIKDPSIFRIVFEYLSDNAKLSDLKIDGQTVDGFNKNTLAYEKEILEDKNTIKVLPVKEEENAVVNLKRKMENDTYMDIQRNDENGEYEVELNELGIDTNVQIEVIAEDGVTAKTYELTIKRPYGTASGSISTNNYEGRHVAQVKVYNTGLVDWENLTSHDNLPTPLKEVTTSNEIDSGEYELKLIPGEYDILIDKVGYLDYIYTNVKVEKDKAINFEKATLMAGDANKDGYVEIKDYLILMRHMDQAIGYTEYYIEEADFDGDSMTALSDIICFIDYMGYEKTIIEY